MLIKYQQGLLFHAVLGLFSLKNSLPERVKILGGPQQVCLRLLAPTPPGVSQAF